MDSITIIDQEDNEDVKRFKELAAAQMEMLPNLVDIPETLLLNLEKQLTGFLYDETALKQGMKDHAELLHALALLNITRMYKDVPFDVACDLPYVEQLADLHAEMLAIAYKRNPVAVSQNK